MLIHGECFDNGVSGRCNVDDCEKFWRGGCDIPGEIVGDAKGIPQEDMEEIFSKYPELIDCFTKEEVMSESKLKTAIDVQVADRQKAGDKLMAKISRISKIAKKAENFFDEERCKEVYSQKIMVPIRVTCLESSGEVRIFLNAFGASASTIENICSVPLIKAIKDITAVISDMEKELGCENLSDAID